MSFLKPTTKSFGPTRFSKLPYDKCNNENLKFKINCEKIKYYNKKDLLFKNIYSF